MNQEKEVCWPYVTGLLLVLCKLVNFEVVDLDKANVKDACSFSLG